MAALKVEQEGGLESRGEMMATEEKRSWLEETLPSHGDWDESVITLMTVKLEYSKK